MEQSELRLGNLVSYRGESVCIVSNIGNSFEAVRMIGGNLQPYGSDDINEFEPLALTDKSILDFGFVFKQHGEIIKDDFIMELFYDGHHYTGGEGCAFGRPINSVHQLQNIYYDLTGKELILSNEKD